MDEQRVMTAEVMRLSEPGDRLLKAVVLHAGPQRVLELLSATRAQALCELHDAAHAAGLQADPQALVRALDRWAGRESELDGRRDLRVMKNLGARLLLPEDAEWPIGLEDLGAEEPLGLWVRGSASVRTLLEGSVALVGARAADGYGTHLAGMLAWELVARGRTVISGGAFGIDAAAHAAALNAAESSDVGTAAFMAGGVDRFYPQANSTLLADVAGRYAVLSEAPPGATGMRHRFLMRNRLIAAASCGTVVVQAGWRSGAINTANRAAELLRPVGAVPGAVTAANAAGCHRLIREGAAVLVTSTAEVEELIGPASLAAEPERQGELRITDDMSADELQIYSALPVRRGAEAAALAVRAGLDAPGALAALAGLELAGYARRGPSGWVKSTGEAAARS